MRPHFIALILTSAGCVDGVALREGTRGVPPSLDAALDARILDQGVMADARTRVDARPPDAGPRLDATPPADAARVDLGPDPDCVPETCNDLDDDCDGSVDEGVADCCMPGTQRGCGLEVGQCTLGDQFCTIDLIWSPCSGDAPRPEVCDGALDEDCDGRVDEGVANACGACGDVPAEQCNGADDDCDDVIDEGTLNVCGGCGPVPEEVCNGADDDCDGEADEGVLNACGGCGAPPSEICDGVDDDCDGRVDEAACYAFVLDDADGAWRAPPGLNSSPLVTRRQITAAFTTVRGGEVLWAVVAGSLYAYDIQQDRWVGEPIHEPFGVRRVDAAWAVPAWWSGEPNARVAGLTVTEGETYKIFDFDPVARSATFVREGSHVEAWAEDPGAPRSFPLQAVVLDLFDNADYWPGDVAATCGRGGPGPITAVLTAGRLFTGDAGTCFEFLDQRVVGAWRGFSLPSAPPPQNIVAWAYLNRPDRTGKHIIILDRPEDGR